MTDVRVSQAYVLAATSFPSEEARVTQSYLQAGVTYDNVVRVTQAYVLAAVKGQVYDPKIRAWTFTIDGHDFYVIRLGGLDETLVYDDHAESWYIWGSSSSDKWKAYNGCNWSGADYLAEEYGSSVVVGDDANGSLYFLDPEYDADDSPVTDDDVERPFHRLTMAQDVAVGYKKNPCFSVNLLGSIGENPSAEATLTAITLYTSDNQGHTYTDRGTVSVTPGQYNDRLQWRSLGSYGMPGRLFKIEDYGALKRIDYLEMEDGSTPASG